MNFNYLIVVVGPTGIGKTDLSIQLAQTFNSVIISGDSRQIFKELHIGTAAPTSEQLLAVPHYLIKTQSIHDDYSAYTFEQDALKLTSELFKTHNPIILTGGSMMYIDALCNGIDELPTIDKELRYNLKKQFDTEGIDSIRRLLKKLDPVFYNQVDLKNPKRVIHAVEICLMTGQPYSNLRTNSRVERPFKTIKIGLNIPRDELYARINNRVDKMIEQGLLDEVKELAYLKHLNALNTVGYKELFDYLDEKSNLDEAIESIKQNTRRYAKRQITWFIRDNEINWFEPVDVDKIINFVQNTINTTEKAIT